MKYLGICIFFLFSCSKGEIHDSSLLNENCTQDSMIIEINYENRAIKYYKESGNLSVIKYLDTIPKIKSIHKYNKEGILIKKVVAIVENKMAFGHYYEYYENGMPKTYRYISPNERNQLNSVLHFDFNLSGSLDSIVGSYLIDKKFNSLNFEWQLMLPHTPFIIANINIEEYDKSGKSLISNTQFKNVTNFIFYKAKAKMNVLTVKCNYRSTFDSRDIEETHSISFNENYEKDQRK